MRERSLSCKSASELMSAVRHCRQGRHLKPNLRSYKAFANESRDVLPVEQEQFTWLICLHQGFEIPAPSAIILRGVGLTHLNRINLASWACKCSLMRSTWPRWNESLLRGGWPA